MSFRVAVAAGLLLVCAGCGSSPSSPAPVAKNLAVSVPVGATSMGANAYDPNPVSLKVGDSVTWTNNDTRNHTMTDNSGLWNSGTIAPGSSFSQTFTSRGTYTYHCSFHSGMVGTVNVE